MTLTKNVFRQNCLKKIKKSSQHNKFYKNYLLNKKLIDEISAYAGKKRLKILFYYPLPFEADIRKSLKILGKKHEVFIPFMEGKSFKMVPFRLPLKKKNFGVFEAGNTIKNINKIDIAIVPAVGVDGKLQRVGFGKGMYDRFFEKLNKKPYTIFTQPEFCYTKKLICDAYDVSCDVLITPRKTIKRGTL
ncbi:5-formyltetrahydrofolate cyclo-ligase [Sulfurimonas sp.]|uniref:5-formyltetrahydrofolate cyclo-ligase n=1 Tax=Sulfurimonas sp. TaxID=2022749 RepID=UPI002609D4EA|nr:5-formyltetrahydrofolate cyclo-ligase [Sulfurimonas sp.]